MNVVVSSESSIFRWNGAIERPRLRCAVVRQDLRTHQLVHPSLWLSNQGRGKTHPALVAGCSDESWMQCLTKTEAQMVRALGQTLFPRGNELGIDGLEVQRGERGWRFGDRVLHSGNEYEKGVFNGDVGRTVGVVHGGSLRVRYPEKEVDYTSGEISDLTAAFALTVHRSQGGEYPAVVIPLTMRHALMLQRNLLYTAVTRARSLLVLVGSRRALELAVANTRSSRRHSRLDQRLNEQDRHTEGSPGTSD